MPASPSQTQNIVRVIFLPLIVKGRQSFEGRDASSRAGPASSLLAVGIGGRASLGKERSISDVPEPEQSFCGISSRDELSSQRTGTDKSRSCRQAGRAGMPPNRIARPHSVLTLSRLRLWNLFGYSTAALVKAHSQIPRHQRGSQGMLGLGHPAFRMANHKAGAGLPD